MFTLILSFFLSFPGWTLSTPMADSNARGEIIKKTKYLINYNEDHEVANWVEYTLEKDFLQNCTSRTNNFRADPQVSTGSSTPQDYKKSGYDRGHLVPAGDMKRNKQVMSETFFMSNMTPQPARFNQVTWNKLEGLTRAWASKYEKIWIITGPILIDNLPTIGQNNRVSIPKEYFKVILRKDGSAYKGIGFLIPTTVPHDNLERYSLSIKEIEEYAQINFFRFLNAKEEQAEENLKLNDWDFRANFEYLPCLASETLQQK